MYIFIIIFTLFYPSFSTNYYIDYSAGLDKNNGSTIFTPFKHCPGDDNALDNASSTIFSAGDTVFFKGGIVYRGEVTLNWSGTSKNFIVYDGNSDGNWGSGRSKFDLDSRYYHAFVGSPSYITIDNFDISAAREAYGTNPNYGSIRINTGDNLIIRNCYFHDFDKWNSVCDLGSDGVPPFNPGIYLEGTSSNPINTVEIDSCIFWKLGDSGIALHETNGVSVHDCDFGNKNVALADRGWFSVGIKMGGQSSIHVYNCRFHDGWQYEGDESQRRCHAGDWLHIYQSNSRNPYNIIIERNFFYNDKNFEYVQGSAFCQISDVNTLHIRNNIFVNQHAGVGLSLVVNAGRYNTNVFIVNNTFITFGGANTGKSCLNLNGCGRPSTIKNNIFINYNNQYSSCVFDDEGSWPSFGEVDNNIYYTPNEIYAWNFGSRPYYYAYWLFFSSDSLFDKNSYNIDPKLSYVPLQGATSSSGDYQLSQRSICVDNGADFSSSFQNDYNNKKRHQGTAWDIGAYESPYIKNVPNPPQNLRIIK